MIAFGTTKTRIYAGGKAGGAAATCLIASLETSKFVTSEKSRMPRHGGWDAASLCYRCVAIQQNRVRHSALYSHAQDVVPCVEIQNKPIESLPQRFWHKTESKMSGQDLVSCGDDL